MTEGEQLSACHVLDDAAMIHAVDVVDKTAEQVEAMLGNDERLHGAFEVGDYFAEICDGLGREVRGGFVEKVQINPGDEGTCAGDALQFAARERVDAPAE